MKDRLRNLKKEIEKEFGDRIDTPLRKRHYTYARAVYCMVAREMSNGAITYEEIGKSINRDHATVMHNIKVVFPFAVREKSFKDLYDALSLMYQPEEESPLGDMKPSDTDGILRKRVVRLIRQNRELKSQISMLEQGRDMFDDLYKDLKYDELLEVYDKMSIMVKLIKSRVYV